MNFDNPFVRVSSNVHLQNLRCQGEALSRDAWPPQLLCQCERFVVRRRFQNGTGWRGKDTVPTRPDELPCLQVCLARTFLWQPDRDIHSDDSSRWMVANEFGDVAVELTTLNGSFSER